VSAFLRALGILFAVLCALGMGSVAMAQAQEKDGGIAPSDAERIASLEDKLAMMEERLQSMERRLGENSTPLVASNGAIPIAAVGSRAEPAVLPTTASASVASTASASPATQTEASQGPTAPFVGAGPEGFSIQSPKGDFRLGIRYQMHVDGAFSVHRNPDAVPNTFYLRRSQPILSGTLYGRFNFQVLTDFGLGRPRVLDAYVDTVISPAVNIRIGKFKGPVGLERLRSGMALPLQERALPTQLVPNRDVGLELFGDLAHGRLSYTAGIFDGSPDGSALDIDTDDHKEFEGRLMLQPFMKTSFGKLAGLSVGVGGSYGNVDGSLLATGLPGFSTSAQRTFFKYRRDVTLDGTVVANGVHYRLMPQGYYYVGPFGWMSEFVQSVQEVQRGSNRATMNNSSWQVMTSYVLTGENGSFAGVNPSKPLDPSVGNWGAFEIAVRYAALHVDQEAFPIYADSAVSASDAKAWGLALNWYWNRNVKVVLGYEQTRFDGATPGVAFDTEKLFQQRFQLRF
jgi:phosphate-selective porin OprO and OprP